ncbi:hypothetical protein L0128_05690 [candidate division KSB1 bacterium]|nr:hypothetical protein [candidate division KSB1 bacterium]
MDTRFYQLDTMLEIELHLMTTALFYGDFSAIQALTQKESRLARAIQVNDLYAARKIAIRALADMTQVAAEKQPSYTDLYHTVQNNYQSILATTPIPLPESYLKEFVTAALELQKFLSAHNVLLLLKKLDQKINEFLTLGFQHLNSKEMVQSDKELNEEIGAHLVAAARNFYFAIRLKMPLGLQYQYWGVELFSKDHALRQKYERYIEQSLLKEIVEFAITYLIRDEAIAEKICHHLKNNKIRKSFLKNLAICVQGSPTRYQEFVQQYLAAAEQQTSANDELSRLAIQRLLLGRVAGSDLVIHYLAELAASFPISPLLVKIELSPENAPYLAPIKLNNQTLLEFLELA